MYTCLEIHNIYLWDKLEITRMSDQTKGKQIKDQKEKRSAGIASGHTTPAKSKRPFTEVANSSAEEIVLLSNQVEEISLDVKALGQNVTTLMSKSDSMMTKADIRVRTRIFFSFATIFANLIFLCHFL